MPTAWTEDGGAPLSPRLRGGWSQVGDPSVSPHLFLPSGVFDECGEPGCGRPWASTLHTGIRMQTRIGQEASMMEVTQEHDPEATSVTEATEWSVRIGRGEVSITRQGERFVVRWSFGGVDTALPGFQSQRDAEQCARSVAYDLDQALQMVDLAAKRMRHSRRQAQQYQRESFRG